MSGPQDQGQSQQDNMAAPNPPMSVDGAPKPSSTSGNPPARISMHERYKLLRASKPSQARTRTSASPLRAPLETTPMVVPSQASSPQAPSESLQGVRALTDSVVKVPSQGSSPKVPPDSLPVTRALSESRKTPTIGHGSPLQDQPKSLPANGPKEAPPTNSHRMMIVKPPTANDSSLDAQRTQTVPPQPSIPPQPRVHVASDQRSRLMVPPMPMPVEVPLVVRSSQDSHHMPARPNYASYHPSSQLPMNPSLTPYKLTPNEHTVSLAMNTRVREQYIGFITMYQQHIMELMHSDNPSEECFKGIEKLLDQVDKVTTHSDLAAQQDPQNFSRASPIEEADWAENCSLKFQFLHHFLEQIRNSDMHVSIVAQPGRLLNIIETFLKGRGIVYFRPDGKGASLPNDPRFADCRCQVSIVPSGPEGMNLAVKRAALVIAFDGSVNVQQPQVYRMRIQEGADWLTPVAHLLVYKSAEHITRCLPPEVEPVNRLKKIVSCMTQVRHEVGALEPEDCAVAVAGQEVGISLELGGQETRWTLPEIRPISLSFLDSSRDSSTQEDSQPTASQEGTIQSSALKRTWVRQPSIRVACRARNDV